MYSYHSFIYGSLFDAYNWSHVDQESSTNDCSCSTRRHTCVVNTTELNEGFFDIKWVVAGVLLSGGSNQAVISNGSLRIGTLQQRVSEDHVSSVPVQCAVLTINNPSWEISVIRKSENATLTAYGETLLLCALHSGGLYICRSS